MKNKQLNIVLIGCGKMGSAMLRGWLSSSITKHIYVLDPHPLPQEFENHTGGAISYFKETSQFLNAQPDVDVFIIAVKPQIIEAVCISLAAIITPEALVLSLAAGQTMGAFEKRFNESQPVIRAMPNTPAAIGEAITVVCANAAVTEKQKQDAEIILKSIGQVEWINEESLLDPVTAVSGSGPAYVFLMIEALAKAGEISGLAPEFSMKLARQTVIGSAALAAAQRDIPAATLRENVTSPGGTTAAALKVLMNGEFQNIMNKAVSAATARSQEL